MTQIQLRHDTSANWTAANPVLAGGEIGVEIDTNHFKVGNGSTAWNDLDYQGSGSGLSLAEADARYARLSQIGQPNGVAGLDDSALLNENDLPIPPVDLVILFDNNLV